jgi:membrane protease YdiL (CAAX protease family)
MEHAMNNPIERKHSPEVTVTIFITLLALPMAIPVVRKLLGNTGGFLRDLGFLSGPPGTPLAWGLAMVVSLILIGFSVKNVPPVTRTWNQVSWLKGLVVFVAIVAATVEEAFFRRFIMDAAQRAGWGSLAQIAVSAFTFGIAHAFFGLVKGSWLIAGRASLVTGIMGGLLAIVYIIGKRSLAPCITAHFLITLALEPGLLIAAVTGEWRHES